jgi:hypothetical protein
MATYLYDDGELIEYTLGDDLNAPVRSLFLISDEETIFDVTIEFTDDEIVDLTLPLVQTINGKHYYSLPWRFFNYIKLTGSQEPSGDGSGGSNNDIYPNPSFMKSANSDIQVQVNLTNNGYSLDMEFTDFNMDFDLLPTWAKQSGPPVYFNYYLTKPNTLVSAKYYVVGSPPSDPGANSDSVWVGFSTGKIMDHLTSSYTTPATREGAVWQTRINSEVSWENSSFADVRFWYFNKLNGSGTSVETRGPHQWSADDLGIPTHHTVPQKLIVDPSQSEPVSIDWIPTGTGTGIVEIRVVLAGGEAFIDDGGVEHYAEFAIPATRVHLNVNSQ